MTTPEQDMLQRAVILLTGWLDNGQEDETIQAITLSLVNEPDGELKLIVGLTNLAGILLMRLEREAKIASEYTLRDIALKYLGQ